MSYDSTILALSPVAYWKFSESSGSTAADSSGNGSTLTGNAPFSFGASGLVASDAETSVSLTDGYFNAIAASLPSTGTGDFAVTWVGKTTSTAIQVLLSGTSGTNFIFLDATGKVASGFSGGSDHTSVASVNDGSVHYIVITRESGNLKYYIDGTLDTNFGAVSDVVNFQDNALLVGIYSQPLVEPYIGTLGRLAYFATALSSAQVAALYAAGTGGGGGDTTPPVVSGANVNAAGTTLTISFAESGSPPVLPASAVTGFTLTASGGAVTLSSTAISGTTFTAVTGRTIASGETLTLGYAPGNVTDSATSPNSLATFSGTAVTNNSTAGGGGGPIAYTSNQAGNWATSTVWTPNGVPGAGDTVTIQHAIAITANTTIGTGAATTAIDCSSLSGTLAITGCKLTIRGDATFGQYNSGTVRTVLTLTSTTGHPAGIVLDGNSGVTPTVTFGSDTQFNVAGLSTDHASIDTLSGTAGNPGVFACQSTPQAAMCQVVEWTDIRRLAQYQSSLDLDGNTFSWANVTYDDCSFTPSIGINSGGVICTFDGCSCGTDAGAYEESFTLTAVTPNTTGTRTMSNCVFLTRPGLWIPGGFTLTNVVMPVPACDGGEPNWANADGCLFTKEDNQILGIGGSFSNSFFLFNPSVSPISGMFLFGGGEATLTATASAFQYIAIDDTLTAFMGITHSAGVTLRTLAVTGNILLPPQGNGARFCELLNPISDVTQTVTDQYIFEHNTLCTFESAAMTNAAGFSSKPGAVQSLRSNLVRNAGTPASNNQLLLFAADEPTFTTPVDVIKVTAGVSQADHNGHFGLLTASGNVGSVPLGSANGTVYFAPATAVPGIHDVANQDPGFVDETRSLQTWDASLGGAGTVDSALARIQADPSLTKSSLLPYIRAGFLPTNAAYINAAHDGTNIGAVQSPGFAVSGPTRGDCNTASSNFTITPGESLTGNVTVTLSGGGLSTPIVKTFAASSTPQTFTIDPPLIGNVSLSFTNTCGVGNPGPLSYLSMVQLGSSGTAPSGNNCPSLGGQDLFANGTWLPEFKRDITGDAVDPESSALIALYGSANLHVDFRKTDGTSGIGLIGIPYNVVPGTQTTKPITFTVYPSATPPTSNDPSDPGPVPILTTGSFEGFFSSPGVPPSTDGPGDQHCITLVRNETTGLVDTIWESETTWTTDGGATWNAHGGCVFDIATGDQRPDDVSTAEAGGMSIFLGLIRYDEVQAVIAGLRADLGHAIRYSGPFCDNKYVWPAKHTVNDGSDPNPPMGSRLRISSSWYAANASSYTGQARVIIDAMRKYGLVFADITGGGYGLGPFVEGVSDDRWDNDATTHGIYAIGNIPVSAFEMTLAIPGWTHTGPTSGEVGTPYTFTVASNPAGKANYLVNIFLTLDGGSPGSAYSTTSINLTDGHASGTYTFTPAASGVYTLHGAPGGQEWFPPAPITFTATGGGGSVSPAAHWLLISGGMIAPAPPTLPGSFISAIGKTLVNDVTLMGLLGGPVGGGAPRKVWAKLAPGRTEPPWVTILVVSKPRIRFGAGVYTTSGQLQITAYADTEVPSAAIADRAMTVLQSAADSDSIVWAGGPLLDLAEPDASSPGDPETSPGVGRLWQEIRTFTYLYQGL